MTGASGFAYDLAIVGGGINGLAVARDAAVRGLSVILIERDDLGAETSEWSSRMIHGGLRYLESFDVKLVRESLREREILFRTASHLVTPMQIMIPVFTKAKRGPLMIRAGMVAYDVLSYDKSVSRHRFLSKKDVRQELPGLRSSDLLAGAVYTDGQVPLSERLCVELAVDAARHGATIVTKSPVVSLVKEGARVSGVRVQTDRGEEEVRAHVTVNAAGPWVDRILSGLGSSDERLIGGTKGSHIVIDRFPGAPDMAVHFETESGKPLLIIPWLGRLLVGSTDELFEGDADEVRISPEELSLLVGQVNRLFPDASVTEDDVLFAYSGVRPLPYTTGKSAMAITRRHHVHDHGAEAKNLLSIVGGKLTTNRSLAEEVVDAVVKLLDEDVPRSSTARLPFPGWSTVQGRLARRESLVSLGVDAHAAERLTRQYGALADGIAAVVVADPGTARRLVAESPVIAAEVLYAVDCEWAKSLVDILFRRTVVGFDPGLQQLAEASGRLLTDKRGWTPEKVDADMAELAGVARRLRLRGFGSDKIGGMC